MVEFTTVIIYCQIYQPYKISTIAQIQRQRQSESSLHLHFMTFQTLITILTIENLNCETQPPVSIGWVALSSVFVVCSLFVPHRKHLLSSPLYDVSDHTNYIFSVRIWSWQHVSVIHCWVEPSLLLSEFMTIFVIQYLIKSTINSQQSSTISTISTISSKQQY